MDSMLFNIFGKKHNKNKPIDVKKQVCDSILALKRDLETLDKKENYISKQSSTLKKDAIQLKNNNKNKQAVQKMKLYKLKEKQLDFILNSKIKLEEQINTLEQSLNNSIVISSMKTGKKVLEKMKEEMDVDDVSELMEDIQEKKDDIDEISQLLAEPSTDFDDADLLAELEEEDHYMETERKLLELPSVPTSKIIIEEEELCEEESEESDDDNNALMQLEAEFV